MNNNIRSFNAKAKALFDKKYKSKNIMTPEILAYGVQGIFAYELSEGTGFRREPIFGVTVMELSGTRRHDLSQMFHSLEDADEYIHTLKWLKSLRVNPEEE